MRRFEIRRQDPEQDDNEFILFASGVHFNNGQVVLLWEEDGVIQIYPTLESLGHGMIQEITWIDSVH